MLRTAKLTLAELTSPKQKGMTQQGKSASGDPSAQHVAAVGNNSEVVPLAAARARAMDQAGVAIASQLNGPLTALLLYMGEIKQHGDKIAQTLDERVYLQTIIENALEQTEQVCALVKRISGAGLHGVVAGETTQNVAGDVQAGGPGANESPLRKPLTRREREVLKFISEGLSNKQGALRMNISPRTFESHRAEAMRKLGARNTADLVRVALLNQLG
jgi:DNA-binding CsgD family transcriptional regulator